MRKFLMQHPGTKFYRSLCVNACGAYRDVPSRSSRKDIPGAVIQHVLSLKPPGRFLELKLDSFVEVPLHLVRK
jgi:hypothetical protein